MSIIESFGPTAATLGGGFFVGILIEYALKKVVKLLSCNSWIILNWVSLPTISSGSLHKLE
jgi:uncharacterized membrane protein (Fun14 family)